MNHMWNELTNKQRISLCLTIGLLFALTFFLWYNISKTEYKVLYSDLLESQAASVIEALDAESVPFRLRNQGSTVLVPEEHLDELRVRLNHSELPFATHQGFELFDTTDYGMTDFAQKIQYQRALQGEIARTIMLLEEVDYARVHLVLPEATLFKRDQRQPKASVTLIANQGAPLTEAQQIGIQKMVANAVDGMLIESVTLLNQQGVALSASDNSDKAMLTERLDEKMALESYLQQKALTLLTSLFPNQVSVVTVDIEMNYDKVETTTESILPNQKTGEAVLVSSSEQRRFSEKSNRKAPNPMVSEQKDMRYEVSKAVAHEVKQAGTIHRLSISVIVPKTLDTLAPEAEEARLETIRSLISGAVGLSTERGDTIAVAALLPSATHPNTLPDTQTAPDALIEENPTQPLPVAPLTLASLDGLYQEIKDVHPNLFFGLPLITALLMLSVVLLFSNGRKKAERQQAALLEDVRRMISEAQSLNPSATAEQETETVKQIEEQAS